MRKFYTLLTALSLGASCLGFAQTASAGEKFGHRYAYHDSSYGYPGERHHYRSRSHHHPRHSGRHAARHADKHRRHYDKPYYRDDRHYRRSFGREYDRGYRDPHHGRHHDFGHRGSAGYARKGGKHREQRISYNAHAHSHRF